MSVSCHQKAHIYAEEPSPPNKQTGNGKSTSFNVLQLQKDLTARSQEIRALADYNEALVLYLLAAGDGSVLDRACPIFSHSGNNPSQPMNRRRVPGAQRSLSNFQQAGAEC